MIISVAELRTFITTTESDAVLSSKLAALEVLIRKYTNNNFQNREIRAICDIESGKVVWDTTLLAIGDTIQISESRYSDGVYNITAIEDGMLTLNKSLLAEDDVLCTKVIYPEDIQMGVVNLMNWDLNTRSKVGIQSETISRHSVTYFNMDGDNSTTGYPRSLMGFLQPYMKARF